MIKRNAALGKALFLDRDGVINIDKGYVHRVEDCEFVPGIFDICRLAKQKGFLLIVATNQSGIARGYFTEENFLQLMDYIRQQFTLQHCPLDDIFYCPYHEKGMPPWQFASPDRKPAPGMLLKAIEKHRLDPEACILLGDKETDLLAGRNAGIQVNILMDGPQATSNVLKLLGQLPDA